MHSRLCLVPLLLGVTAVFGHDGHDHGPVHDPRTDLEWSRFAQAMRAGQIKAEPLPAAPEGVSDLSFTDFFGPVGSRGLDYSARMKALAGKRVRISGYMVRQQKLTPGMYLLSGFPVETNEVEYGMCDDLPAALLHVLLAHADELPRLVAGPLVLTGTLEVGPQVMADGRTSLARLRLDDEHDHAPIAPISAHPAPLPPSS